MPPAKGGGMEIFMKNISARKYAYMNANRLNGKLDKNGNMPALKNAAVFVDGETITGICTDGTPDTTGREVIDLRGAYLLPGLINLHVHFVPAMPVKKPKPGKEQKKTDLKAMKEKLSGFKRTGKITTANVPTGLLGKRPALQLLFRTTHPEAPHELTFIKPSIIP